VSHILCIVRASRIYNFALGYTDNFFLYLCKRFLELFGILCCKIPSTSGLGYAGQLLPLFVGASKSTNPIVSEKDMMRIRTTFIKALTENIIVNPLVQYVCFCFFVVFNLSYPAVRYI